MGNARQDRGKRTNVVVAAWLKLHGWAMAKPTVGAETGQDVKFLPGVSVEVKARTNFDPMVWLKQAKANAEPGQRACVVIRCNGQGEKADDYLVIRRLADDELAAGPACTARVADMLAEMCHPEFGLMFASETQCQLTEHGSCPQHALGLTCPQHGSRTESY